MKNTKRCPKCGSQNIVRIPDNQNRHASGNNMYTSTPAGEVFYAKQRTHASHAHVLF